MDTHSIQQRNCKGREVPACEAGTALMVRHDKADSSPDLNYVSVHAAPYNDVYNYLDLI